MSATRGPPDGAGGVAPSSGVGPGGGGGCISPPDRRTPTIAANASGRVAPPFGVRPPPPPGYFLAFIRLNVAVLTLRSGLSDFGGPALRFTPATATRSVSPFSS